MRDRRPPISVRLEDTAEIWVRDHAEQLGEPVNAVMRRAVQTYRTEVERNAYAMTMTEPTRRPPAHACPEVQADGAVIHACWLPRTQPGPPWHDGPHLDAVYRINWFPSDLTAQQAAELLEPEPARCGYCDSGDRVEWFPGLAAYACQACLAAAALLAARGENPSPHLPFIPPMRPGQLGERPRCGERGPEAIGEPACSFDPDHRGRHSWQDLPPSDPGPEREPEPEADPYAGGYPGRPADQPARGPEAAGLARPFVQRPAR